MSWISSSSAWLLLCAACVAIVPSCYRVELSLDGAGDGVDAPLKSNLLPWIGSRCKTDQDCGEATGLSCLGDSSDADPLGSPAEGLCTADCVTDADCRRFGKGSVCGSFAEPPLSGDPAPAGSKRWCLQSCDFGSPSNDTKCQGRTNVACRPFAAASAAPCSADTCPDGLMCFRGLCRATACGPRCNTDEDCPTGRHCSAETGLCDAVAEAVVPVTESCSASDPTPCGAGVCFTQGDRKTCTQSCTLGSVCAQGKGACVQPRFDDYAAGDIGYCTKTCDCDDNCKYPGDYCYPWRNPLFTDQFVNAGYCQPKRNEPSLSACTPGRTGSK